MKNHINKVHKHLTLLREIGDIKQSLLGFIHWSKYDIIVIATLVSSCITRFEKLALTRGRMAAIDEMKSSRLAFTRGLCGRPLSGKVGAPIAKNGLPKVIPKEIRARLIKDKDLFLIKAVITCLSLSRFFKGGKPVDMEAITAPSNPTLPENGEIILGLRKMGIELEQSRPQEGRFSGITTAGPNGPSITLSLQDLPYFNEHYRPQVNIILPELLPIIDKVLSGEKTYGMIKLLKLATYRYGSLRKISVKDDKEGKSRIFAIFDYGSQTVLSPLHDGSFSTLRKIPQDCTFNQEEGIAKILKSKSRKYFYSYDLKSATDRFPVVFQERVLSLVFDKSYAKAWSELMTREPFRIPGVENLIKGETGQPLGAKSSGGVFTLCHHLVVHIAAIRTNSDTDYVILGDDIVIRGRTLATEYKRIMSLLGVEISNSKSHVSKDTFEFAKIGIHKGMNSSGFPIVGIAETLGKPLELAALFVFEMPKKGYLYSIDPRTVSTFFLPVATGNIAKPRHAIYIADKVCGYFSFLSGLSTKDGGWAKYIVQSASLIVNPSVANLLFSQVIRDKWAKQLEKTLHDFQDFGMDMLTNLRELPPFQSMGDPESYPGRMSASGIEFSAPVRNIPIFAALQTEGHVTYSDYIQSILENEDHLLTLSEIDELRLPPRPQLKGFVPVRAKESIRTLSLISRGLNRELMTKWPKIITSSQVGVLNS